MIDLYTYTTSNGNRVSIMLEECDLKYRVNKIDLRRNEQKQPEFLKLSPSGRIPVIVDHDELITLSQSSAILLYLAEKTDQLIPKDSLSKSKAFEWLFFHATDVATTVDNAFFLMNVEWVGYRDAVQQLNDRVFIWYQYFDQQLSKTQYIAGAEYSVADIAMLPSITDKNTDFFEHYKSIGRWRDEVISRPAVQAGLGIIK